MTTLYKIIHVENLEAIVEECRQVIEQAGVPYLNDLYNLDKDREDRFRSLPLLRQLMIDLKLYDHWLRSAIVVTYDDLPIHVDDADDFYCSFNIPIKNTKNTFTTFYETTAKAEVRHTLDGYSYKFIDPFKVKVIGELEMTHAAIINTKVFHNIIHRTTELPRINLLLRLRAPWNLDDNSID